MGNSELTFVSEDFEEGFNEEMNQKISIADRITFGDHWGSVKGIKPKCASHILGFFLSGLLQASLTNPDRKKPIRSADGLDHQVTPAGFKPATLRAEI